MSEQELVAAGGAARRGRDHLRLLGRRVGPLTAARERTLPVLGALEGLFPGGALQRGWVIATEGAGATSLALAVAAGPSMAGSWTAVVGEEGLGLAAAAEAGMVLERLLVVTASQPRVAVEIIATLVGSVDVVLVGSGIGRGAGDHRRLAARLREGGSVLIRTGGGGSPHGADVCLQVVSSHWSGLGAGRGLLRSRRVSVRVEGRGAASRPRTVDLLLPGPDGSPVLLGAAAQDPATPLRPAVIGSADPGDPGAGLSADRGDPGAGLSADRGDPGVGPSAVVA